MAYTICYVWQDLDAPEAEQKFGDHYVPDEVDKEGNVIRIPTLAEAFEETRKYVRGTLGRQKHKFDEGRVVLHKMWDVTEYAKRKNRFGKHQKVDDVIRPVVGHHVAADVHRIDADLLIERVNKELIKFGQPLPVAGLAQWQVSSAENVLAAVAEGKRTIVAELCARFGKTIWSGALIRETGAQVTVVASYVLTSFASFRKDLTSFEQFRDLVLVDAGEDNWQDTVTHAVEQGQQAVVFLSMCSGGRRQEKIDFLFGLSVVRLVVIDEADFGVHRSNQSAPLIEARGEQDVVILMTGTNGDKAASVWPVDHYLSVTYPELLIEKHKTRLIDTQ